MNTVKKAILGHGEKIGASENSNCISLLSPEQEGEKRVKDAWAARLMLESQLALTENSTIALMKFRGRIPAKVREMLGLSEEPNPKNLPKPKCPGPSSDGSGYCGKVVSVSRIRCMSCFMQFIAEQLMRADDETASIAVPRNTSPE